MQKAAFLDLDGVLIKRLAMLELAQHLWATAGAFNPGHLKTMLDTVEGMRQGSIAYARGAAVLAEHFCGGLWDQRADVVERAASGLVAREGDAWLFGHALPLLAALRADGYRLVLASDSASEMVRAWCDRFEKHHGLPMEACCSLVAERDPEGRYTGRALLPPEDPDDPCGKRESLHAWALENGVDLLASTAFGDAPGDLGMLLSVGHPVVLNAGDHGLGKVAVRQGWLNLVSNGRPACRMLEKVEGYLRLSPRPVSPAP